MRSYQIPEKKLGNFLKQITPPFVFLETGLQDQENKSSFLFKDFIARLEFRSGDSPELFFKKIDNFRKKGYWLCGYFTYEFGYCLEKALDKLKPKKNVPLAWLGVVKKPTRINNLGNILYSRKENKIGYEIKNILPNLARADYGQKIKEIKKFLEQGLTYQVNFTFKVKFDFSGNPLSLYLDLRKSQPTSYSALVNTGKNTFLSFSPELFFRIENNTIITRPMKGTSGRGATKKADKKAKNILSTSKKIKAENLMIVDLLRNDLGRIAKSVWVPKLFDVEGYQTLFQMTSTIKARLKENLTTKDIFSALFPCGSVTGAPKIKTMEIIKGLEKEPRNIYTGAIGYIGPKKSCFNVAIRTIQLKGNSGELGIGGGIVYDSESKAEYEEALLKAKFFMPDFSKFYLFESMLWTEQKSFYLLDLHLKRLARSANFFGMDLDLEKVKEKLKKVRPKGGKNFKVRVIFDAEGRLKITASPIAKLKTPVKVIVSKKRLNPDNHFLYHKTNQRVLYLQERARANKKGFFEVIFLNKKEELAEGSLSNIFILKNKKLYTPPVSAGLLAGTLRQDLINKKKVREKTIYLKDILCADKIYIGNSVRGLLEAKVTLDRKKIEKEQLFGTIGKRNL